jgi:hypothetical protein
MSRAASATAREPADGALAAPTPIPERWRRGGAAPAGGGVGSDCGAPPGGEIAGALATVELGRRDVAIDPEHRRGHACENWRVEIVVRGWGRPATRAERGRADPLDRPR